MAPVPRLVEMNYFIELSPTWDSRGLMYDAQSLGPVMGICAPFFGYYASKCEGLKLLRISKD